MALLFGFPKLSKWLPCKKTIRTTSTKTQPFDSLKNVACDFSQNLILDDIVIFIANSKQMLQDDMLCSYHKI